MSLKDKYQPVLDLMDELNVRDRCIKEERGALIIEGKVDKPEKRNLILNKIYYVNKEKSLDIVPRIDVESISRK